MARPLGGFRSRVRGVLALEVHHGELAALPGPRLRQRIGILFQDLLDDGARLHPLAQQRERFRPVADVDDRLGRRDAGLGVGPQHAVADREDARLHGAADLARRRIEAENRERAGVPERRRDRRRVRARGAAESDRTQKHRDDRERQRSVFLHHEFRFYAGVGVSTRRPMC